MRFFASLGVIEINVFGSFLRVCIGGRYERRDGVWVGGYIAWRIGVGMHFIPKIRTPIKNNNRLITTIDWDSRHPMIPIPPTNAHNNNNQHNKPNKSANNAPNNPSNSRPTFITRIIS